jgi:hypothetical protein
LLFPLAVNFGVFRQQLLHRRLVGVVQLKDNTQVLIDGRSGCVEASKMKVDLNAACLELGNFQYLYSTFDFKG